MADLKDKVVVVTGASSGIGLETARAFAREGCRVAIGARREERLEQARLQVLAAGAPEVIALPTDVQDEAQVRALIGAARDQWRRVDILVNNAGYGKLEPFVGLSVEDIRDQMETNYFGAVYAIKAVLEDMLPRRSGHIINIDSVVAKVPAPGYSAYSATKAALDALSQALRAELAQHGIIVTAVHPSATRTEFWEKSGGYMSKQPFGRFLMQSPETVARAIVRAAKRPKPEVYPQFGTQLLPLMRAALAPLVRLALRGMARIYR